MTDITTRTRSSRPYRNDGGINGFGQRTNNDVIGVNLHETSLFVTNPTFETKSSALASGSPAQAGGLLGKDLILNEHWSSSSNISGKITGINKEYVRCSCLVDEEAMIFENRTFPRILFEHLFDISVGVFVLISVKTSPGSMKFDVYKGDAFVDKTKFERNKEFEVLSKELDPNKFSSKMDYTR